MERCSFLLLLMFLCSVDAQGWKDKFESFGSRVDRTREKEISTKPRYSVLAPDVLTADFEENLVLQMDGAETLVHVSIEIWNLAKDVHLNGTSTVLTPANRHFSVCPILLPSKDLDPHEKSDKYVYLKITFDGFDPEWRLVLVSFPRGFIFIQTDKPIYNPGQKVRFRTFVSSPGFQAAERIIRIDIKNPDGIVVFQKTEFRVKEGVFNGDYALSELANEGLWTVTARFDHREQNTFNATFEVKKYVLPAFNVTLTTDRPFFSIDDKELVLTLTARYLYGKPVQGKAYILFGVKHDEEKIRLRTKKEITQLEGGKVTLTVDELRAEFPNIRILVGKTIYVKASVLTDSGGDLVEVEKGGIRVVISPYVVTFRHAPRFFKPELPLDLTLDVHHHDGSPVDNVKLNVTFRDTPLSVVGGVAHTTIIMPPGRTFQAITVKTLPDDRVPRPEQQARKTIYIRPYEPPNDGALNLLHISTGVSGRVPVGKPVSLEFKITTQNRQHRQHVRYLTYVVLNKGRIVRAARMDVATQILTKVQVPVTAELMPSFRVVAFYIIPWTRGEEVVSDSVYVDVEDSCVTQLSVGPEKADSHLNPPEPGETLRLKLEGEPGASVSLVAVDNSVFLLRKERLTQAKIWGVVEQSDLGCSRGGGSSAKGVFSDAGLMFHSSSITGLKTNLRQKLQCTRRSRWRRSAVHMERKTILERQYRDELLRRCCMDGLRRIPMPYSCTRRSLYITEGVECMRAFRHCCGTYHGEPIDPNMPTAMPSFLASTTTEPPAPIVMTMMLDDLLPYSKSTMHDSDWNRGGARMFSEEFGRVSSYGEEDDEEVERIVAAGVAPHSDEPQDEWVDVDENDLILRKDFRESWFWMDYTLPTTFDPRTRLASRIVSEPMPDSITEWTILGVSSSSHSGFCVAEPYNVKTFLPLFVDLKMPYSVARNEQIQIKVVIYNYSPYAQQVRVTLMKTEDICSVAFRDKHVQNVTVPAGGSMVVPYTVVPQRVGLLPIEVIVVPKDYIRTGVTDNIKKELRVVAEGVQKTKVQTVVLNPSAEGGTQTVTLRKIDPESIVPNTKPETYVSLRGSVLADSLENSLRPDVLAALINMPGGCVEQNLASMSLPTIAVHFLDNTKDWVRVGPQRRDEALGYIRKGYADQLSFRREDGSYPPYKNQGGSTWVTAFVVKVFSMVHSIIGVDEQLVCQSLSFLLKERFDREQEVFIEETPVYSTTISGGLRGDDPQVTLAAFVLIALAEAEQAGIRCNISLTDPWESSNITDPETLMKSVASSLMREVSVPGRRPYTVAIASYALALLHDKISFNPTKDLLNASKVGADGRHWADLENPLFSLEATGYALLALVKMNAMREAEPVFKWLTSQQRLGGGYGSTQPTVVVLQALTQYVLKRPPQVLDLNVKLTMGARSDTLKFTQDTLYAPKSPKLLKNEDVEVHAEGTGQGVLEMVTYYNRLQEEEEKTPCNTFELRVAIEESLESPPPDAVGLYQLNVTVRSLSGSDVRMVVLDVALPTGFIAETTDLDMLSQSVDKYISEFKTVDNLSDRGSLILHLFKVSHREPEILVFKLKQIFNVGLIQPSSVTAYEYYNPDERCTRSFTPRERTERLAQICSDNVCRCTQGDCCVPKSDSENFSKEDRESEACDGLRHVYKVRVLSVSRSYYDEYEMQIIQVIKEGREAAIVSGQTRTFLSHGACRDGLQLVPNQDYLIIGPKDDIWKIESATNRVVYLLGKNTWVERWPSVEECGARFKEKCDSLAATAKQLSSTPCHS